MKTRLLCMHYSLDLWVYVKYRTSTDNNNSDDDSYTRVLTRQKTGARSKQITLMYDTFSLSIPENSYLQSSRSLGSIANVRVTHASMKGCCQDTSFSHEIFLPRKENCYDQICQEAQRRFLCGICTDLPQYGRTKKPHIHSECRKTLVVETIFFVFPCLLCTVYCLWFCYWVDRKNENLVHTISK